MSQSDSLAGKRIAVYARYSSANQRETSIEDQVRVCREHVERRGGEFRAAMVFEDRARSGASLARPAIKQLIASATGPSREIDVIVTEDLSRLSRDFEDAASVFKRLQYANVRLIGVSDGVDTSAANAKLPFMVRSIIAEAYLDDLRQKTRRGLEGRALAHYSTGGLPFGYRSEAETNSNLQVVGQRIVVDPERARVLKRIFAEYANGRSYAGIAALLNAEQVPAPRAASEKRRAGWVASAIREMLRNPKYIGRWTWGKRLWQKEPETGKRRYRAREDCDVIRLDRSDLRLVDDETWNVVQERLAAVGAKYAAGHGSKDRAAPGRKTVHPFSGLLFCASCGAPMVIAGGSPNRIYRCGDAHKRGTCKNRLSVKEAVVRRCLLEAIRERLATPWGIDFARKCLAERLGDLQRSGGSELKDRLERHARTDARIANLVGFIADGDGSEAVRLALRDLEAQRRDEAGAIEHLRQQMRSPVRLPTRDEVRQRVFDLEALMTKHPIKAREVLRQFLRDGRIVLHPQPNGLFIARTDLLPLVVLAPQTRTPPVGSGAAVYNFGCAGLIPTMYTRDFVRLEVLLAA